MPNQTVDQASCRHTVAVWPPARLLACDARSLAAKRRVWGARMPDSRLPGFHKRSPSDRLETLVEKGWLTPEELPLLERPKSVSGLDRVSECVIGPLTLPRSVVTNVRIDHHDVLLPFSTEEPSIVAACSKAAKLARETGGVTATRRLRMARAQVLVQEITPERRPELEPLQRQLALQAKAKHPRWAAAGGDVHGIVMRPLPGPAASNLLSLDITFNPADSMGANLADSLASLLAAFVCQDWARVLTSIVSNHPVEPHLQAFVRVPVQTLTWDSLPGIDVASRIQELSQWAEADPYRCVTHNKGVLNGIEALLLATYQDVRAAASALLGVPCATPRPLVTWRVDGLHLCGRFEGTIPCGIAGGTAPSMPEIQLLWRWMRITSSLDLEVAAAAAGLLQNLGALVALATEGIEAGHLRLHARKHGATT